MRATAQDQVVLPDRTPLCPKCGRRSDVRRLPGVSYYCSRCGVEFTALRKQPGWAVRRPSPDGECPTVELVYVNAREA